MSKFNNYLIIGQQLPSLNTVVYENRKHAYKGSQYKKEMDELVSGFIFKSRAERKLRPVNTPVGVLVVWQEKSHRRDVDNIESSTKFILDALQKNGIIPKDDSRYVKQINHYITYGNSDKVFVFLVPFESERQWLKDIYDFLIKEVAGND